MNPTVYYNLSGLHRPNGPALVREGNRWNWAVNGTPHRYYGPADHLGSWKIHGEFIKWDTE